MGGKSIWVNQRAYRRRHRALSDALQAVTGWSKKYADRKVRWAMIRAANKRFK